MKNEGWNTMGHFLSGTYKQFQKFEIMIFKCI